MSTAVVVIDGNGKPKKVCGAKLTNRDELCMNAPVTGKHRCPVHGGATPNGIDSPMWRGRAYARHIPKRYIEKLEAVVDDPELTGLRNEIALTDVRIGEKLEELSEETGPDRWERLIQAADAAHTALHPPANDPTNELAGFAAPIEETPATKEPEEILEDLIALIREESREYDRDHTSWQEINTLIEQRRRLASSEVKREEILSGQLTAKQAIVLVTAIKAAIMDEVKDLTVRQALLERIFVKILNQEEKAEKQEVLVIDESTPALPLEARRAQASASQPDTIEDAIVEELPEESDPEPDVS